MRRRESQWLQQLIVTTTAVTCGRLESCIESLVAICNEFSVPVVEDAAESLGSRIGGKHTGTYGQLGTFSFNGNKIVTCGGGGVIVTDNLELAEWVKHVTTTAKAPHPYKYFHTELGYNYRLPNLNAALACAQLECLENFILNKRQLTDKYRDFFGNRNAGTSFTCS